MGPLLLSAAAIFALTALTWAPAITDSFLADDFGLIRLWYAKPVWSFFVPGDLSEGIWGVAMTEWRPVTAVTFRLDYLLHGVDARGFHLSNILLHATCTVLVFLIMMILTHGARATAWFGALAFLITPVHAEPISWITGRVETVSAFFYLVGFLCFLWFRAQGSRFAYAGALTSFLLGLMAKEIVLTLPAMLLAYDLTLGRGNEAEPLRRRAAALAAVHAPFFAILGAFLGLRLWAFGYAVKEDALSYARVRRWITWDGERLRLLLAPFSGTGGMGRPALGVLDVRALVLTAVVVGILVVWLVELHREGGRLRPSVGAFWYFFGVWHVFTVLPLVMTYFSARHLYLPSVGIAVALGFLVFPLDRAGRTLVSRPRMASALIVLALYAITSARYLQGWTEAGAFSRRTQRTLAEFARGLPKGALLVLPHVPGSSGQDPFRIWRNALPAALQPPYQAHDLYSSLRFVEHYDLYCCPIDAWWRTKVMPLQDSPGAPDGEMEINLVEWDAPRGQYLLWRGTTPTRKLGRALRGLAYTPEEATRAEADRLLDLLVTWMRRSANARVLRIER